MNKTEINGAVSYQLDPDIIQNDIGGYLTEFGINNAIVEISFVKNIEIHELNKSYRHKDAPTDVLSFPQIEIAGQKVRHLGNIVISPEMVGQKNEEMDDVIKHGILHLLGFDHEDNLEKWDVAARKINCKL